MTSPAGRKAWASVFDNVADEIDLARRLAPVLPIANRDEFSKLIELMNDLQSIWIERGAKITEAEQEARWAGAALLWNMSRVWMRQSKTYTFPSPIKDDESRLVQVLSCAATESLVKEAEIYREPVIANGAKLFSEIVQFSDGKTPEAEISGLTKPSKGKLFIDELEVSVRSFLCFMPPAYDTDTEKTSTVVDHFEATQRIAFYRATANLAAKIAVAAKAVRPNLGFAGETTAKDVAQAAVRALLVNPLCNTRPGEQSLTTFLPLRQSSVPVDDNRIEKTQPGKTARRAYAVLAGEALLLAIHFCESYLTSVNAILPWQDRILRDQVRALTKVARSIDDNTGDTPKEILDAATTVCKLGTERMQLIVGTDFPAPRWFIEPPPFPIDEPPKGPRNDRKRRNSDEPEITKIKVRGVAGARAIKKDNQDWDTPPSSQFAADSGMNIRGVSKREDGKREEGKKEESPPLRRHDIYRPGGGGPQGGYVRPLPFSPVGAKPESLRD